MGLNGPYNQEIRLSVRLKFEEVSDHWRQPTALSPAPGAYTFELSSDAQNLDLPHLLSDAPNLPIMMIESDDGRRAQLFSSVLHSNTGEALFKLCVPSESASTNLECQFKRFVTADDIHFAPWYEQNFPRGVRAGPLFGGVVVDSKELPIADITAQHYEQLIDNHTHYQREQLPQWGTEPEDEKECKNSEIGYNRPMGAAMASMDVALNSRTMGRLSLAPSTAVLAVEAVAVIPNLPEPCERQ